MAITLPYENLSWIQDGEAVAGTTAPDTPNGPANRCTSQNLENVQYIRDLFEVSHNDDGTLDTTVVIDQIYDGLKLAGYVGNSLIKNGCFEEWFEEGGYEVPVSWDYTDNGGVPEVHQEDTINYQGFSAKLDSGATLSQYVSLELCRLLRSENVYFEGMIRGEGNIYLRYYKDDGGWTEISNESQSFQHANYTSFQLKGTVPATTEMIIVDITTTDITYVDNLTLASTPQDVEKLVEDPTQSKQIEFWMFDATNPPDEGVENNCPVVEFNNSGVCIGSFGFPVPNEYLKGDRLFLEMLVEPADAGGGDVKMTVEYKYYYPGGSVVTSSVSNTFTVGAVAFKMIGFVIPQHIERKDAIFGFKVSRDPADGADTYANSIRVYSTEIKEISADMV